MIRYARFSTPLGTMLATARGEALTGLYFEGQRYMPSIGPDWVEDGSSPALAQCRSQVTEYFEGRRRAFDVALQPEGSEFQRRVWSEIARIPYGKTLTYAELAARAGAPGSARAAGSATGRNPHTLIVPCHRVVGSDGSLTGYAGGVPRKMKLLEIEDALHGTLV
jgi:methylated-DNA-[protein]-cysteine S-methyltransferase